MTQATSRSNKKHFSSWNALNHSDKCSNSFKLRSNMYLSLGPKDMAKRLINIRKRVLIYSCFIARDTWRHMSARLNKGHAQSNSRARLFKGRLWSRIALKPTVQPMTKFSQLICWGWIRFRSSFFELLLISHFLSLRKICLTDFYFTLHGC